MEYKFIFVKGYLLNDFLLVIQSNYMESFIKVVNEKEFGKFKRSNNKLLKCRLHREALKLILKENIKILYLEGGGLFFLDESEKVFYFIDFQNNEFKELRGDAYNNIYSIAMQANINPN